MQTIEVLYVNLFVSIYVYRIRKYEIPCVYWAAFLFPPWVKWLHETYSGKPGLWKTIICVVDIFFLSLYLKLLSIKIVYIGYVFLLRSVNEPVAWWYIISLIKQMHLSSTTFLLPCCIDNKHLLQLFRSKWQTVAYVQLFNEL